MAPITSGDAYLGSAADRIQAGIGSLDKSFAELPSVIPRQMGGRRYRKSRKQQRGGMSPFGSPEMLLDRSAYTADGTNPQFQTEGSVNSLYGEFSGAQKA
jgi:hypothetical protein